MITAWDLNNLKMIKMIRSWQSYLSGELLLLYSVLNFLFPYKTTNASKTSERTADWEQEILYAI